MWWGFLGLLAWETASQMTMRELQPGYKEALQQRASSLKIKRLLLIKENHISQVKEFSVLHMGRCKNPGSLKLFLSYAFQRSGASAFHALSSFELTVGSGCSLISSR